jgi:hypothetical protein
MMLVLLLVLVVGAVVMFVVGFVKPRKSKAVQGSIDRVFFKGHRESEQAPGELVPKALEKSIDDSREVLDKSAKAGREARTKGPV